MRPYNDFLKAARMCCQWIFLGQPTSNLGDSQAAPRQKYISGLRPRKKNLLRRFDNTSTNFYRAPWNADAV